MSVLLLDAGNTRLKWALCERGVFSRSGAFTYDWLTLQSQFDDQWGSFIREKTLSKLAFCNVVGDRLVSPLHQWIKKCRVQETDSLTIENVAALSHAFGVRCAYEQPAQLGADRWAALVAARSYISGTSCVIDCGTALTIDVLSSQGEHLGGLIAPGMSMMRQSLSSNTAQIDVNAAADASLFVVKDTASAVQAGIMAATVGAVQQALQQCEEYGQTKPICIVTGGDAQTLLPSLPKGSQHEPEWILKGLAIIANCHE